MTFPLPEHRSVEAVQTAITESRNLLDRAEHQIESAEKNLGLLASEQLPKSPSLARMDEILKDYQQRKANLEAEHQSAIDSLQDAQQNLEQLQQELSRSEAEEARLTALDAAWIRYDSVVRDYAKVLLEIHRLNPDSGVAGRPILYRRNGQCDGYTYVSELARLPGAAERFFTGFQS
jgi:chromosome segregation ATPase